MRLALFSDVHGNPIALQSVLEDIQAQGGVDAYWVLGDLAAIGYDPVTVIERVTSLPDVRFTRGNTDSYLVSSQLPSPTLQEVRENPDLLPKLVEVARSFAWSQGSVTAAGWLDWLAELPLEQRLLLPDGTRLLGVHASPGTDDGDGLYPALDEAEFQARLAGCEADLVCVGHTHTPMDRTVGGVRVVNLGSVSNPATQDLRASYALLEAGTSSYQIEIHKVEYDREAVIAASREARFPGEDWVARHMRGQVRSSKAG